MSITANAVSQTARVINTTAGKLYIPVIYLDVPINQGDDIFLNDIPYAAGGAGVIVQKVNNVVTAVGDFDGGVIKTYPQYGNYYADIIDENGNVVTTVRYYRTIGVSGNHVRTIQPVFVGTNGVAACRYDWLFTDHDLYSDDALVDCSSIKIGILVSTHSSTYSLSVGTSATGLEVGRILYTGSSPVYNDPYEVGGTSEEDLGGDGSFDGTSDTIADSTPPSISCANTGFTRIFNPTLAQVQALANYLWTDTTFIGNVENIAKKLLENPMDAFIAFNLVPCAVPDGGLVEFKVLYIGTGVNMTVAASQFVDVDCGSLDIDEYYGSALDYAPNTKVSVFLPFIGTVQLDTDDVMGKTLSIKYRIDIVSGGCVAKIFVGDSIHYQYSGHCAINIPFTSADYTGYISAMLQAAKIGATIASSGAAAGAAALEEGVDIPGMIAEGASESEILKASEKTDPWKQGASAVTRAAFNSLAPKNISNTVNTVMASKPVVERSGSFSGNTGYLGIRRPFCIIERPRMCNPAEYGVFNGRPSMLTLKLGECSGFTKVQQTQLTGIPATNPELDEIGAFLKGGVIL